ncbi:ATP-dependent protease [Cladophialophora carrionii]|uniref:ATP-dependent protease n=1 Tax=Cladophialophora carrionii TaxID=86049 RepID=A0A1C1CRR1_9EURO|nr:ATP-dependent protease [Cladophialophora carrionii]
MSDGLQSATTTQQGLDAHQQARDVVKLFQCEHCSYPLREPMTLPCGNTLCRPCLPPLYKREHITYPVVEGRSEAFLCPFEPCASEHSVGDCATDVTLNKIGDIVKTFISSYKSKSPEISLLLEEKLNWPRMVESAMEVMPRSRVLHGGRIVSTFTMADMGELDFHSGVAYTPIDRGASDAIRAVDVNVLENLREVVRPELECQVCYQVMLDPSTTTCGHTFCRRCLSRAMDHSNHCPMCRRLLPLAHTQQAESSNKRVADLIHHLFPDLLTARKDLAAQEDMIDEETNLPLFPCTLAYPRMPTFLHIFEPRYRLMIRRVLENGTRKFGMLAYKPQREHEPDGPDWQEYGTVLFIDRVEVLPDGRSLLETRGLYKFRTLETAMLDGYLTGRVQRVDDISIHEEEAMEAQETSVATPLEDDELGRIQRLPTQQLLEYGLDFIQQAQGRSARWLHQRVLAAYGQPPEDAATFPYWLASVLPITESERYTLLPATSVRERLKITAEWIHRLEQARCEYEAELAKQSREEQVRHGQITPAPAPQSPVTEGQVNMRQASEVPARSGEAHPAEDSAAEGHESEMSGPEPANGSNPQG